MPAPGGEGESPIAVVGRYAIYDAVASGGMATVHLGRLLGSAGFLRTVAIKRLHPQYAHDKDFTAMFLDEARLAARVQHPNVVPTLDVVVDGTELLLVMEYVRGVSLSQLTRAARDQGIRIPPRVVVAIMCGALHGLHAAHDATDEKGAPLDLVHRDVSPQNVLVGVDGIARVLDFGIAKAAGRVHSTREGEIKGKLLYMPPEQLAAEPLSRATDVYAAGIVLFESLTNIRMFAGEQEAAAIKRIIMNDLRMPSSIAPELEPFDPIVRRAAASEATDRYATAFEMAAELERVMPPATPAEVGDWVRRLGGEVLDERAKIVAHVERSSTRSKPPPASPGSNPWVPAAAPVASGTFATSEPAAPPEPALPSPAPTAAEPAAAPARRPTAAYVAVGTLLALLALAVAIIVVLVARAPAPAGAEPAAAATTAAAEPAPEPMASAPVVIAPPATTPSAAATPAVATATSKPVVRPVVAKPKRNCDPPYTVDKKGHRHFIPECVQ